MYSDNKNNDGKDNLMKELILKNTVKTFITTLVLMFTLSACASSVNDNNKKITVYINSGAIQCEFDGLTGNQTADLLIEANVAVNTNQCGHLTSRMVIAKCGARTTRINLHEIVANDLEKAKTIGFADVHNLKKGNNIGYEVIDCK